MNRRAALAGISAAAAWAAAEPLLRRVFRTPYSDVRLLGAAVTQGPLWPVVGLAAHLTNGAVFGLVWSRLGGRDWKDALAAAEVENLAFWPAMALVDRYHPDRRSGAWPPLLRNARAFGYEVTTHAIFGAVLGRLGAASVGRP